MNILVTGATGFVGNHLVNLLHDTTTLYGTAQEPVAPDPRFAAMHVLDVRDANAVQATMDAVEPDAVIHLAAQSHVGTSFRKPWSTLETNIKGTLTILYALRNRRDTRLLLVSSSEVYGLIAPEDLPITESHPIQPTNPYGVSKRTQELLAEQYALSDGQNMVIVRPFNHIGPGQSTRFALPNFAEQIAYMEKGKRPPVLKVGNLAAERDFTDVRDVCRAYESLLTHATQDYIFNIGSGRAVSIRHLVDMLAALAEVDISVEVEPERMRPIDVPRIVADASRLHNALGWQPQFSLEQSVQDILEHARASVS